MATLSGWQVDATLVDVVIALSVVFVAVLGLAAGPTTGSAPASSRA